MKIENNGLTPLTPALTEAASRVAKKETLKAVQSPRAGQDTAEMSESARLLSKARAALGTAEDVHAERLPLLKQQIASGDYTVQVGDLARKLVAKLYPK
jgi:flagellar biosynthesis anti-sigma factor FlgM